MKKISKNESPINYTEINKHSGHDETTEKKSEITSKRNIRTEKEINELITHLIKENITENLEFHINNLHINKIY